VIFLSPNPAEQINLSVKYNDMAREFENLAKVQVLTMAEKEKKVR